MSADPTTQTIAGPIGRALRRLRRTESAVLVSVLILILSTWSFIEIAGEVTNGGVKSFDERIMRSLRDPANPAEPIGPRWLEAAALDITALGGHAVLTLVVISVAGYLLLARKRHAMWLILLASLGGWGAGTALKVLFGRERPQIVPHLVEVQSLSFPSGHAMMSAVVYLTLGALLVQLVRDWWLRVYVLSIAVLVTCLVGVSRVFLGVHYPTDVLGGWAAGLVWAIGCWLVARWLQRRGIVEQPEEQTGDLKARTHGSA